MVTETNNSDLATLGNIGVFKKGRRINLWSTVVKYNEIILDLLVVSSDISFATKTSGDIPDNNSLFTSDSKSFATSNSKYSRYSIQPRSSKAMEEYLLHLENKIESEFQLRVDNNKLLTSLLSSAKISSIDEITELSTTIPSIKKYNTNHAKDILPFVEINTTSPTDIDIITLATVIASAVATANPTKTLRLPPFTPSDIKS